MTQQSLQILTSVLISHMKFIKISQKYFLLTFWEFFITFICDVKIDVNMSVEFLIAVANGISFSFSSDSFRVSFSVWTRSTMSWSERGCAVGTSGSLTANQTYIQTFVNLRNCITFKLHITQPFLDYVPYAWCWDRWWLLRLCCRVYYMLFEACSVKAVLMMVEEVSLQDAVIMFVACTMSRDMRRVLESLLLSIQSRYLSASILCCTSSWWKEWCLALVAA